MPRKLLSTLALGLGTFAAQAQDGYYDAGYTEAVYLDELPVVLTATRLAQPPEQTPAAVTVLDRDAIRASGARDVVELLRYVAGMQVTYYDGSQPFVAYHGLVDEFSRRIQVLVDGRSVYNPLDGTVPWNEIPLSVEDVARIEVVRGPDAPTYGANAFLATINIITESGASAPGWLVRVDRGVNRSLDDVILSYGTNRERLDYRLSLGYQEDQGFASRWDGRKVHRARLRADYQLSPRDALTLHLGYAGGPRRRGYEDQALNPAHTADKDSRIAQLVWHHSPDERRELRLQIFRNDYRHRERFLVGPVDLTPLGLPLSIEVPLDYSGRVIRDEVEVMYTQDHDGWRMAVGASLRRDRAESATLLQGQVENRLYRAFLNAAWQLRPQLLANVGLMAEDNQLTGGDLFPRLALNYRASEAFTWRASLTRASRLPTLWEAFANLRLTAEVPGVGILFDQVSHSDVRLRPERMGGYELGFIYHPHRRLSVDYKIHYEEIRALITAVAVPYPDDWNQKSERFINGDSVYVTGSEVQVDWRYARHGRVLLGYADTHISGQDRYRAYTQSAPHTLASLLVEQRLPDPGGRHALAFSLGFHYSGPMVWLGEGDAVGAIRRVDLRIAREFRFPDQDLDVELIVQSAQGSYVEFRDDQEAINLMTPTAYLRLRWNRL